LGLNIQGFSIAVFSLGVEGMGVEGFRGSGLGSEFEGIGFRVQILGFRL
jgi:hypothetical protein